MNGRIFGGMALSGLVLVALAWALPATALEVNIAELIPYVDVMHEGKKVRVMRIQDTDHVLTGGFTKTSRSCPPFCYHPMQVAPGVTTVGEVEVVKFMADEVNRGSGLIIDARTPQWYQGGTIPGSVNIPFTILSGDDIKAPELQAAMEQFGARQKAPGEMETGFLQRLFGGAEKSDSPWDFSQAKNLLLFCNGPWCDQSPRAIKGLLNLGYPAEKLFYYRGGMQNWQVGGFTTVVPEGG